MRDNSQNDRTKTRQPREQHSKRLTGDVPRLARGKLMFFGMVVSLAIIFLLGRIVQIQTVHGDEFERRVIERTARNQVHVETFNAVRGQVFDRERNLLSATIIRDNIVMDVRELYAIGVEDARRGWTRKATTLEALNDYLGIPMSDLLALFELDASGRLVHDTHYRIIARDVDPLVTLGLMQNNVRGIFSEPVSIRSFTHTALAPQILGFTRGDAAFGIENSFGRELAGQSGRFVSGDSTGLAGQIRHGYSLVTTLDVTIQQFAEEAARSAGIEFEAEAVSVIVMNPHTAEIIAMAQYPSFDNNHPDDVSRVTNPFLREFMLQLDQPLQVREMNQAWNNFSLLSSFEPGSIFKPIIAAAALEEGVTSLHSLYFCGGGKWIFDDFVPCWINQFGGSHGVMTLEQAIAVSCNVAIMDIAAKMGPEMFHRYFRYFGFGERTGIDLPEASFAPLVYSLSDLRIPVQLATSAMGQGSNSTAIQNITAFAAVINGGYLMRPFVVSQIIDADGNVVYETLPEVQRKILSGSTSDAFRDMMVATVTPMGTGTDAGVPGYTIGGKTGTGQQGRREDGINSFSFIGYFPAENPQYITMVFIHRVPAEISRNRRVTANIVSRELTENIIRYRGIQPDEQVNFAENVLIARDGIELMDMTGLDLVRATTHLNNLGLDYEIVGNGNVIERTIPRAGQRVMEGSRIFLYMEDNGDTSGFVVMPDVVGLNAETATVILESSGLRTIVVDSREAENRFEPIIRLPNHVDDEEETTTQNTLWEINVYEQMPAAEIRVPEGTVVRLRAAPPRP